MRKEKLVTNDIYYFLTEVARASVALSLLWELADAAPTPERIDATVFLVREISDRMHALDYFLGESGDLSEILAEYKNKFDIYDLLAERKKRDYQ
ncbi:TPA: hypothetical protein G9F27_005816 [Salmonella enterica]|uniref:Uncharacterized protein n=1 Tax=Salmonella enterica TaxID=28901 RepID=A0A743SQZ7_SALER|nr:hypothetical protein [Salmonella enterica]